VVCHVGLIILIGYCCFDDWERFHAVKEGVAFWVIEEVLTIRFRLKAGEAALK